MFIQKRTIAIFTVLSIALYVPSIILTVLAITTLFPSNPDISNFNNYWSEMRQAIIWALLSGLLGFIGFGLSITAHVGATIRQARLQQWPWLICTLGFGGVLGLGTLIAGYGALGFLPIVVLIYLLAVPDVPPSMLQDPHRFPPLAQFIPLQQFQQPPSQVVLLPLYQLPQYQAAPPQPFQQPQYQAGPPQPFQSPQYQAGPPQPFQSPQYQPVPPQQFQQPQYQAVPFQQYPPQQYQPVPLQQYPPQQYQPVSPQQYPPQQYQPLPPQKVEDDEEEESQ